jgi:UDP-N-acetylglucosamine acyltransferase
MPYKPAGIKRNEVGYGCNFTGNVEVGEGNVFQDYVTIQGPVRIGDGNYFGTQTVIGSRPSQIATSKRRQLSGATVVIGDNNYVGECVRIHAPVCQRTQIGSYCSIGAGTHVAHDCRIKSYVNIAPNCTIGGYCILLDASGLGLACSIHPRTIMGDWSYAGAGSVIITNIHVGQLVVGNPAKFLRWNFESFRRHIDSRNDLNDLRNFLEHGQCKPNSLIATRISRYNRLTASVTRNFVLKSWRDLGLPDDNDPHSCT